MLTKNDLEQIRQVVKEEVREEVQSQLVPTNKEIKTMQEDIKGMREDIKTIDMKVELVNTKVDTLHKDTRDGFGRVFEAIEQNDAEQKKNMRQLKEFVGMN